MIDENNTGAPSKRGPGAPKGNLNRLVHGAYLQKLLTPEEFALFEQTMADIHATFELNESSDAMLVIMCAFDFVKWYRALAAADEEMQMKYRREVVALLESLKATRDKREGTTLEIKTPAEWAAEMLGKVRAASEKPKERENDGA